MENSIFVEQPTKIVFFNQKIIKITAGARHSLVIDDANNVFAFGDNSEGQCTGHNTRYTVPTKIQFESKETISDIFSGYSHCILISSKICLII